MTKALSAEAVARYRANGFHKPFRVLSEEDARLCRGRIEAFEAAHPDQVGKLDLKCNLLFPWVDEVTRHPRLLDAMEDLLGPDLLCWNASIRNKKALSPTYAGWHQDTRYIQIRPTGVIAFLALSPANEESGTVRVIPGSHKWDVLPHADTHDKDSILTRGQYITADFEKSTAVDLVLQPGEVGFFDHNIVHSSGPNNSRDRRMILLIGYYATHSKPLDGRRVSAFVVRGTDNHRHFDVDPRPLKDFGPEEIANHRAAVEVQTKKLLFDGSDRTSIALS
ncbi:MAG: phytanoyl-CoA dioxygenase family protein [Alphaproteobacteria bacterium]